MFIAPVDTGFAGYLLVPEPLYAGLETMELPRKDFGVYTTMAGSMVLRRAGVEIEVGNAVKFDSFIETAFARWR